MMKTMQRILSMAMLAFLMVPVAWAPKVAADEAARELPHGWDLVGEDTLFVSYVTTGEGYTFRFIRERRNSLIVVIEDTRGITYQLSMPTERHMEDTPYLFKVEDGNARTELNVIGGTVLPGCHILGGGRLLDCPRDERNR